MLIIQLPTTNDQRPTTPNDQRPSNNSQTQMSNSARDWKLAVGSGWELAVGRWTLTQKLQSERPYVEQSARIDRLERGTRHQQVPRRVAVGVGKVRRRSHIQKRREIREAAIRAHERRGTGDDRRLQREVLARMHVVR